MVFGASEFLVRLQKQSMFSSDFFTLHGMEFSYLLRLFTVLKQSALGPNSFQLLKLIIVNVVDPDMSPFFQYGQHFSVSKQRF